MSKTYHISAYIDPFGCNNSRWASLTFDDPASGELIENVKRFLGLDSPVNKEQFERFKRLCHEEASLTIVPTGAMLFENIFAPLRLAKKSYILGDYFSTIALCGMVGEMLALFIFKLKTTPPTGKAMSEDDQKSNWGCTFERLGQEKRVDELQRLKFISEEIARKLDYLRSTRRPYFHVWEKALSKIDSDSHGMYLKAVDLVKEVFDIRIEPPSLKISDEVLRFLQQSGVAVPNGS